jgi:hypothetical protein
MKRYRVTWNPSLHPRQPAGTSVGGQFRATEVKMVKPTTPLVVRVNGKVVEQKGSSTSGHYGHAGRPGKVGGSAPGGGAAYNIPAYLKKVRERIPRPIRDQIGEAVRKLHPDATDHDVDMYLDVMAMDRERFDYYAEKLGLEGVDADAFMEEDRERERQVQIQKWKIQDAAKLKDEDGRPYCNMGLGDVPLGRDDLVGKDWKEGSDLILSRYGTVIVNEAGLSPKEMHSRVSTVLNLAEDHPAIARILKEKVKHIRFTPQVEGKTKAAEWTGSAIKVYEEGFDWFTGSLLAHELGHAAEDYLSSSPYKEGFGRGNTVSSYGWINDSEDWAEWFTATLSRKSGLMDWEPNKYVKAKDVLAALGEP